MDNRSDKLYRNNSKPWQNRSASQQELKHNSQLSRRGDESEVVLIPGDPQEYERIVALANVSVIATSEGAVVPGNIRFSDGNIPFLPAANFVQGAPYGSGTMIGLAHQQQTGVQSSMALPPPGLPESLDYHLPRGYHQQAMPLQSTAMSLPTGIDASMQKDTRKSDFQPGAQNFQPGAQNFQPGPQNFQPGAQSSLPKGFEKNPDVADGNIPFPPAAHFVQGAPYGSGTMIGLVHQQQTGVQINTTLPPPSWAESLDYYPPRGYHQQAMPLQSEAMSLPTGIDASTQKDTRKSNLRAGAQNFQPEAQSSLPKGFENNPDVANDYAFKNMTPEQTVLLKYCSCKKFSCIKICVDLKEALNSLWSLLGRMRTSEDSQQDKTWKDTQTLEQLASYLIKTHALYKMQPNSSEEDSKKRKQKIRSKLFPKGGEISILNHFWELASKVVNSAERQNNAFGTSESVSGIIFDQKPITDQLQDVLGRILLEIVYWDEDLFLRPGKDGNKPIDFVIKDSIMISLMERVMSAQKFFDILNTIVVKPTENITFTTQPYLDILMGHIFENNSDASTEQMEGIKMWNLNTRRVAHHYKRKIGWAQSKYEGPPAPLCGEIQYYFPMMYEMELVGDKATVAFTQSEFLFGQICEKLSYLGSINHKLSRDIRSDLSGRTDQDQDQLYFEIAYFQKVLKLLDTDVINYFRDLSKSTDTEEGKNLLQSANQIRTQISMLIKSINGELTRTARDFVFEKENILEDDAQQKRPERFSMNETLNDSAYVLTAIPEEDDYEFLDQEKSTYVYEASMGDSKPIAQTMLSDKNAVDNDAAVNRTHESVDSLESVDESVYKSVDEMAVDSGDQISMHDDSTAVTENTSVDRNASSNQDASNNKPSKTFNRWRDKTLIDPDPNKRPLNLSGKFKKVPMPKGKPFAHDPMHHSRTVIDSISKDKEDIATDEIEEMMQSLNIMSHSNSSNAVMPSNSSNVLVSSQQGKPENVTNFKENPASASSSKGVTSLNDYEGIVLATRDLSKEDVTVKLVSNDRNSSNASRRNRAKFQDVSKTESRAITDHRSTNQKDISRGKRPESQDVSNNGSRATIDNRSTDHKDVALDISRDGRLPSGEVLPSRGRSTDHRFRKDDRRSRKDNNRSRKDNNRFRKDDHRSDDAGQQNNRCFPTVVYNNTKRPEAIASIAPDKNALDDLPKRVSGFENIPMATGLDPSLEEASKIRTNTKSSFKGPRTKFVSATAWGLLPNARDRSREAPDRGRDKGKADAITRGDTIKIELGETEEASFQGKEFNSFVAANIGGIFSYQSHSSKPVQNKGPLKDSPDSNLQQQDSKIIYAAQYEEDRKKILNVAKKFFVCEKRSRASTPHRTPQRFFSSPGPKRILLNPKRLNSESSYNRVESNPNMVASAIPQSSKLDTLEKRRGSSASRSDIEMVEDIYLDESEKKHEGSASKSHTAVVGATYAEREIKKKAQIKAAPKNVQMTLLSYKRTLLGLRKTSLVKEKLDSPLNAQKNGALANEQADVVLAAGESATLLDLNEQADVVLTVSESATPVAPPVSTSKKKGKKQKPLLVQASNKKTNSQINWNQGVKKDIISLIKKETFLQKNTFEEFSMWLIGIKNYEKEKKYLKNLAETFESKYKETDAIADTSSNLDSFFRCLVLYCPESIKDMPVSAIKKINKLDVMEEMFKLLLTSVHRDTAEIIKSFTRKGFVISQEHFNKCKYSKDLITLMYKVFEDDDSWWGWSVIDEDSGKPVVILDKVIKIGMSLKDFEPLVKMLPIKTIKKKIDLISKILFSQWNRDFKHFKNIFSYFKSKEFEINSFFFEEFFIPDKSSITLLEKAFDKEDLITFIKEMLMCFYDITWRDNYLHETKKAESPTLFPQDNPLIALEFITFLHNKEILSSLDEMCLILNHLDPNKYNQNNRKKIFEILKNNKKSIEGTRWSLDFDMLKEFKDISVKKVQELLGCFNVVEKVYKSTHIKSPFEILFERHEHKVNTLGTESDRRKSWSDFFDYLFDNNLVFLGNAYVTDSKEFLTYFISKSTEWRLIHLQELNRYWLYYSTPCPWTIKDSLILSIVQKILNFSSDTEKEVLLEFFRDENTARKLLGYQIHRLHLSKDEFKSHIELLQNFLETYQKLMGTMAYESLWEEREEELFPNPPAGCLSAQNVVNNNYFRQLLATIEDQDPDSPLRLSISPFFWGVLKPKNNYQSSGDIQDIFVNYTKLIFCANIRKIQEPVKKKMLEKYLLHLAFWHSDFFSMVYFELHNYFEATLEDIIKKQNFSGSLFRRYTLARSFSRKASSDPVSFDPGSFDPVSFDPVPFDPVSWIDSFTQGLERLFKESTDLSSEGEWISLNPFIIDTMLKAEQDTEVIYQGKTDRRITHIIKYFLGICLILKQPEATRRLPKDFTALTGYGCTSHDIELWKAEFHYSLINFLNNEIFIEGTSLKKIRFFMGFFQNAQGIPYILSEVIDLLGYITKRFNEELWHTDVELWKKQRVEEGEKKGSFWADCFLNEFFDKLIAGDIHNTTLKEWIIPGTDQEIEWGRMTILDKESIEKVYGRFVTWGADPEKYEQRKNLVLANLLK